MTIKREAKNKSRNILADDALDPRNVKVRITTFVDEDILFNLKELAKKKNSKYQTILNSLLRSFFDKPNRDDVVQGLSEERVRRIVLEELRKKA